MGVDSRSAVADALLRYGLLTAALAVYFGVFLGGFATTLLAMSWIDANVVQPAVGGRCLVSFLLFGVVQLGYVAAFFRVAGSDTVFAGGSDKWATFQEEWR